MVQWYNVSTMKDGGMKMNNAVATYKQNSNLVVLEGGFGQRKRPTASPFKSNGVRKAVAADPIRSAEDIKRLLARLKNTNIQHYTLVSLGLTLGIRAGDLVALKVSDVYTETGTVREYLEIYEEKTGKRNRLLITEGARTVLVEYGKKFNFDHDSLNRPLFKSRNGNKAMTISGLNRMLKRNCNALGITGHISSHTLRKTFVYHCIQQNKGNWDALFTIQSMLNHASFKTTLTYCGIEQDDEDKLRAGMASVILG